MDNYIKIEEDNTEESIFKISKTQLWFYFCFFFFMGACFGIAIMSTIN